MWKIVHHQNVCSIYNLHDDKLSYLVIPKHVLNLAIASLKAFWIKDDAKDMQSYYSCNRLGYNLRCCQQLLQVVHHCKRKATEVNRLWKLKIMRDTPWWHFWKLCSSRMSFICKLLQFNQKSADSVQPSLRDPRSIQTSRIRVNRSFKKVYDLVLQHMSTMFENHQKCLSIHQYLL